ncbi:MAG: carboxylating nicotinate-nucleotide diphosphorylase [bacterium]
MPFWSQLDIPDLCRRIRLALQEDIGDGDLTTAATVDNEQQGSAVVVAKGSGIVCGLRVFEETYHILDEGVEVNMLVSEGHEVRAGEQVLIVSGKVSSILTGERVALNFLGWLSGVATLTRQFADRAAPFGARIADTRKTTPLWRDLEKYAVQVGGGVNHRSGLDDMILIKENHIDAAGSPREAVARVRKRWAHRYRVEIETRNLREVYEALDLDVDRIMLDNFPLEEMAEAVTMVNGERELEASGGVNLSNVADIARTGVDIISAGALTHSSIVVDYSMLIRFKPAHRDTAVSEQLDRADGAA